MTQPIKLGRPRSLHSQNIYNIISSAYLKPSVRKECQMNKKRQFAKKTSARRECHINKKTQLNEQIHTKKNDWRRERCRTVSSHIRPIVYQCFQNFYHMDDGHYGQMKAAKHWIELISAGEGLIHSTWYGASPCTEHLTWCKHEINKILAIDIIKPAITNGRHQSCL